MGIMTREEIQTKDEIIDYLRTQGYATYARILDKFCLNLTADESVAAYMIPAQGTIVINRGIASMSQVSTTIRHEIMHEYLDHQLRLMDHLGMNPEDHTIANIAMDYEISNRMYTDEDKRNMRRLRINNRVVKCLVTEDDHPDWIDLSMEEMYDKLIAEKPEDDKGEGEGKNDDDRDQDWDPQKGQSGGGGSPMKTKTIPGTFKNGQFYDMDGNLITH